MKFSIIFFALYASSFADHQIVLYNNCPFTIWPGISTRPRYSMPMNGGFQLNTWGAVSFSVEDSWQGRIYPRRDCDGNGRCVSGDCGNGIQCSYSPPALPVTYAELMLDINGIDYYDISLISGYNLPMRITPTAGTFKRLTNGAYDCTPAGCFADLNPDCPNELAVWYRGWKVACKSPCQHFNTDQYCCRGAYGQANTCKPQNWPKNYAAIFKQPCPTAKTYLFDDAATSFSCRGNPSSGYTVTFCP